MFHSRSILEELLLLQVALACSTECTRPASSLSGLGGGRGGTINEMYYPPEILFQFFSIRQLRDIAECVAELEKAQSVLAYMGRSSAE